MGGIEQTADFYKKAELAIGKWEREAISNTDIEGPLSVFAKTSLIMSVAELLAKSCETSHPTPATQELERRKPGRPRNVN